MKSSLGPNWQKTQQLFVLMSIHNVLVEIWKIFLIQKIFMYSGRYNSPHSHYICNMYVVRYFSIVPHLKSTARGALKPFWLYFPNSEVFKNGLLCSSSTSRSCAKLSQIYEEFAFFSKNRWKQEIFDKKSKFVGTLRRLCARSRRARRA